MINYEKLKKKLFTKRTHSFIRSLPPHLSRFSSVFFFKFKNIGGKKLSNMRRLQHTSIALVECLN